MPAILRIFLYQTDASLTVIGSADPYDQGAVGGEPYLQQDAVHTCRVGLYKIYNQ